MSPQDPNFFISRLQEADRLHKRVLALSEKFFVNDTIGDMAEFLREAEFLLKGVKGTDAVMGIFNHTTYSTELEVGHQEFWGLEPGTDKTDRMKSILSLAEKGYESFFSESVAWFTKILQEIPFEQRVNFKFHHCGGAKEECHANPPPPSRSIISIPAIIAPLSIAVVVVMRAMTPART